MDKLNNKHDKLKEILRDMGSVITAFSGGVDSTLLLKVAKDVLAKDVMALTIHSETTPRSEQTYAKYFAHHIDVEYLIVETKELEIKEFIKNSPEKCYICKINRYPILVKLCKERGFSFAIDGSNIDDQSDFRPGIRAAKELGIRSPLDEAGFTKKDVRQLSKNLGLSTWNKPSSACLASRIPYYSPITAKKLKQVDDAEEFIRSLGISTQVRVRHGGDTARIEVDPQSISDITANKMRKKIIDYFTKLGFTYITIDLEGYRQGSLNRGLLIS